MIGISSTYYDTLKFLHVVAVIAWVGGGIYAQVLGTRALRDGDLVRLATTATAIGDVGKRLILPAAVAALVFGVWLVAVSELNFTDTWIVLGLVGIAITIVTGAGFLGPESERLGRAFSERGPSDPEIGRRVRRILVISRIDLVVLLLVVADMVFKPGT
jgi:uncharacterized membrane protein